MFPDEDADGEFCRGMVTFILHTWTLNPVLDDNTGHYWFLDEDGLRYRVSNIRVRWAIPGMMRRLRGIRTMTWSEYCGHFTQAALQQSMMNWLRYLLVETRF